MKQTSIYCMVWYVNLKDDIFNMVISQYLLSNNSSHRGHWWCRLQPTSSIITDAKLVDSNLYNFARQGWCRLNREADVITGLGRRHPCRLQRVISRYLQDITTDLSCTAQRVLITIFMQKNHAEICMFTQRNRRGLNRPILRPLWLMTSAEEYTVNA